MRLTIENIVRSDSDPKILTALAALSEDIRAIAVTQTQQGVLLMTIKADLAAARADLASVVTSLADIASDIADLVARAADAIAGSAEAEAIKSEAAAAKAKAAEIASTYTPAGSTEQTPAI